MAVCKYEIPADNSCLFNAIRHVVQISGQGNADDAAAMRSIVASMIQSAPDKYTDAFLGKQVGEYCQWIMKDDSWGGEIELDILSTFYQIQINVVDILAKRIHKYGNFALCCYLLYEGIHYDVLQTELGQFLFDPEDSISDEMLAFGINAHHTRSYTDVNRFQLKCDICGERMTGQKHAVEHANQTGHGSFSEI